MTPDGWTPRTMSDVVERVTTGVSVNSEGRPRATGELGVLKTSAVTYGVFRPEENKVVVPADLARAREHPRAGCVLFSRMNTVGLVGASAYVAADREDLVLPDRIWQLKPSPHADGRWLHALLSSAQTRARLSEVASGTSGSMKNISQEKLLALAVMAPPLHEQRKIAAILSSLDDAIETAQSVIDQLGVVKKAMTAELLTRGVPGRHTRFRPTEIGEVPQDWNTRPCGDLFDVQLGKMMSAEARAGEGQFLYLRNENVYWLRLDLADVSTMQFDAREREKFRLRKGDLLACEGRHIGRCALWQDDLDECYYQKALHRLRARSGEITTEYMQFFMTLRFRYMTDLVAEANATSTIPHLPREKLVALPISYPSRREQDDIVGVLGSLTAKETTEEATMLGLRTLKSALMSVLLTGELRVKPDEETA